MTPEETKAQTECTNACKDKAACCPFAGAKAKVGDTVYFFDSGIIKSTISKRYVVMVDTGGEVTTRFGYTVSGLDITGDNLYTSKQELIDYVNSLDSDEDSTPKKETTDE